MIPDVPHEALLEAMEEFDKELRDNEQWSGWEQKGAYKYAIEYEGKRYPVKQIVSMATGAPKTNFNGGFQANSYVKNKGLSVVTLQNGADGNVNPWREARSPLHTRRPLRPPGRGVIDATLGRRGP